MISSNSSSSSVCSDAYAWSSEATLEGFLQTRASACSEGWLSVGASASTGVSGGAGREPRRLCIVLERKRRLEGFMETHKS